jgi:hypothetical protein
MYGRLAGAVPAGRASTMTHDCKHNGHIDLFAATNMATAKSSTTPENATPGTDMLAFFKLIELQVPRHLEIHVVSTTSRPT